MVEQDLSRKKMYPLAMKVYLPGTETVRSDHFLFLEKVSLSSVSAQKDCLTSLRCLPSLRSGRQPLRSVRQPVLLPYDLGKWNFLAEKKTGPHFRSVPGIHFPRPGEYIFITLMTFIHINLAALLWRISRFMSFSWLFLLGKIWQLVKNEFSSRSREANMCTSI